MFFIYSKPSQQRSKSKFISLTVFCFATSIINGYFFNWINNHFFNYKIVSGIEKYSFAEKAILAIVFAPIIETYLFQHLPNLILERLKITNKFILILLPSILFGLSHSYHFLYVIMTFIGGVILNLYYVTIKKEVKYAFWYVVVLHSFYNLYGLLFT